MLVNDHHQIENFEWKDPDAKLRETRLEDGVFEYSGCVEELVALYDLAEGIQVSLVGFGELPTLEAARALARKFDRIETKPAYSAANGKSEASVLNRKRANDPWPFDEFRENGYKMWGAWIINVILHTDGGQRYGKLFQCYKYYLDYSERGVLPFHHSAASLIAPQAVINGCPGCGLTPCTTLVDDRRILNYGACEGSSTHGKGKAFRYRAYRAYAERCRIVKRTRLPDCVVFLIKLLYPGGELTGFRPGGDDEEPLDEDFGIDAEEESASDISHVEHVS